MTYQVTIPETELDPDLTVPGKDGPELARLSFVWFWHAMLSDKIWDSSNSADLIEVADGLRGRVPKVGEHVGEKFDLSDTERKSVVDVMPQMDLASHFRQLVRKYRLAILRAEQVK